MAKSARLRTVWWTIHRWIGVGLAVLLAPIAVSGALLVWHDHLDALVHPGRYAVTAGASLAPSAYLTSAAAVLEAGVQPAAVRLPESEGWPVVVMARGARTTLASEASGQRGNSMVRAPDTRPEPGSSARAEGGPPRIVNVYLDPPTARVLDVVDFRSSLIGVLHRFHENLTIPEYSGRAVVGWVGVGMLILSLTGIWLWWPRFGAFLPGLRWSRAAYTTTNLHHLLGLWISIPLAVVSFTGIYLGFPQTARQAMSSIAPMTPQGQRPGFGAIARDARLTPDATLAAALAAQPGTRAAVIFLPTASASTNERGRARGGEGSSNAGARGPTKDQAERGAGAAPAREAGPIWRVQLRDARSGETTTVTIDDRSGTVTRQSDPLAGDRAAQWMRWIHEGSHSGPVWQFVVFLTGAFPLIFVITGVMMWWRGRRLRRSLAVGRPSGAGELQAAE